MKLTFGKYNGTEIEDLPLSYLSWLAIEHSDEIIKKAANDELQRRKNPAQGVTTKIPEQEFMNRLAALLEIMPDKLFGKEMWLKTHSNRYKFLVTKEAKRD